MQSIGSLETAEKHISAKIFKENAHFCKDLADLYGSSRSSATILAEPCRKNPADLHRFAKIENLGKDPLSSNEFVTLNILKIKRGPFCIIENFSKNRYIWYSLYPICVKSGMGCVIVEGDSLAVFTAKMYVDCQKGHCQN